jgi:hypothetical protein
MVLIGAGLLLMFAGISWWASSTKSPAYDEPYHAVSSWLQLRFMDYRLDNEDPPLWQYWASLLNSKSALHADFSGPDWMDMPRSLAHQWYWGVTTLYRTPGNDPVKLIARCRAMMVVVAVLLGVLICYWTWSIGGPIAAVSATFLFCLDPNFLAHSSLMKNDVAFAMSMFALALAIWRGGKKLDGEAIGWIGLLCVVNLTVKFSGFAAVILVPLLLGIRAALPQPWPVLGRVISKRFHRFLIAGGITLLCAGISYAGIWAVYGFRYRPTPDASVLLNMDELCGKIRRNQALVLSHGVPTTQLADLPLPARVMLFCSDRHLLPQAFAAGFLFTYANALIRCDYLLGQISYFGWWWYFPFAMLVKTPIAVLIAGLLAAGVGIKSLRTGQFKNRELQWTALCIAVPVLVFLASAMSSHVDIGIRHVLSVYPFFYVAIGCAVAWLWTNGRKKTQVALLALGGLLVVETLSVFPNYIPFFNVIAANSPGGKLNLLADSNLDWGQDLPLLADWQRSHPDQPLYLSYFGYADPHYYGLKYFSLPGGYFYDTDHRWPDPYARCVVAISASNLQQILLDPKLTAYYAHWRTQKPIAVLGDSIYLFEYDPIQSLQTGGG